MQACVCHCKAAVSPVGSLWKASVQEQYKSSYTKGLPSQDTYFQKLLFSFCILSWGINYFVYWTMIILSRALFNIILHGSIFLSLPALLHQLFRKKVAICCQACFVAGLFNHEVYMMYYCYLKRQGKCQLHTLRCHLKKSG